jgi:hypothetical protein
MNEGLKLPEGIDIRTDSIPQYQVFTGLKNLACRAVIIGGKVTNEYHVKPLKAMNPASLATIMRGIVDESEFTLTDPDGLLKLEWPIMMKISSIIGNEIIEDTLKEVDQYLEVK